MTTRQIRIACDGFVISTRPFREQVYEDELEQIRSEIRSDITELRKRGRVVVWIDEGNVAHLMGGAR